VYLTGKNPGNIAWIERRQNST